MADKTDFRKNSMFPALVFETFSLCFRFLSQVFLEIPSRKLIEEMIENKIFFEWPVDKNQKSISKGLEILQEFCEKFQQKNIKSLKQDFTRLFIGLEKMLAPPYASVYLSEDCLLYESPFFDVRRFYRKIGLSVNPRKNEPDDHIGFELFCLSFLCEQVALAARKNDQKKIKINQKILKEFHSGFLNTWLDSFLLRVKDEAQTSFYRGVALLTSGLVESLSGYLDFNLTEE